MKFSKIIFAAFAILATITVTSCKAPQDITYFQDNTDVITLAKSGEMHIKPDDNLLIIVKAKDQKVEQMFNLSSYSGRVGEASGVERMSQYTVDPQGYIEFPLLGKLKVEGMTKFELAGFIKGELMGRDLVKDPLVNVEYNNQQISVLGDVFKPGAYTLQKESNNILEAIALAGDLNLTGNRKNVKVLREVEGQVRIYELDLTDMTKLTKSPGYYLQQNDVVYVEPNDMKKRQSTVNGNNIYNTSFWISVASLITTAVTTIGVFVK